MALAVTGRFSIEQTISKAADLAPSSLAELKQSDLMDLSLTHGTGAGQVDLGYFDVGAPGSGSTTTIDLNALTNVFGDAVAFVKIKFLWFRSAVANTVNFTIFGNAAAALFLNTAATTHTVTPGGLIVIYRPLGVTVTDTTADVLQIVTGAAAGQAYNLILLGTSA